MNAVNVHLIFLVNRIKSHRPSFTKQKYLTEITGALIRLFAKFNVWPPDLLFVMDDWTSPNKLTTIYACVCMCACIQALSM